MENNTIELVVLEEAIERQLEAIKEMVALLNAIGDASSEEEAIKLVDEKMEATLTKVQEGNDRIADLVNGKDLDEQDYPQEKKIEIAVQLDFICKKIDELNTVLSIIFG